jgi:hypothetical protein
MFRGKYHREGAPAIEWKDGKKQWFTFGRLDREELPDGTVRMYENGKLSCEVSCL